jgi:hypothetical protein
LSEKNFKPSPKPSPGEKTKPLRYLIHLRGF